MNQAATTTPDSGPSSPQSFFQKFPWEKITIWGLFLLLVYVLRSFFTTIFLTFIFSYIMTNVVRTVHGILSPQREKIWLHRALTVGGFAILILLLYGLVSFLRTPFQQQITYVAGQIRHIDLKNLGSDILRDTIGAWEYNRLYSGARGKEREQKDLEAFKQKRFPMAAVQDFEKRWKELETGFKLWFRDKYGPIRSGELEGTEERLDLLRNWIHERKAPEIYQNNKAQWDAKWEESYAELHGRTMEQRYSSEPPLEELKKFPEELERQRTQWVLGKITEEEFASLRNAPESPDFQEYLADKYYESLEDSGKLWDELRVYYEDESRPRTQGEFTPERMPFDKLIALYEARDSVQKFNNILLGELDPERQEEEVDKIFRRETRTRLADEAIKGWSFVDVETINHELTNNYIPNITKRVASGGVFLFNFLVQFALSLLLSFFITFDLHRMKKGLQSLRHSRASNFYEEIAPGLAAFGALIGRAFQAQGVIAICNTLLTFALIKGLNIGFEAFLCTIVFICSFIPVLGVVISTVPIALIALIYKDLTTCALAIVGVLIIHFIETSILNPKILGEMLHLHPVLVLCILAVGEHFFKVWGLLLGVPVMVYIIRIVIMGEEVRQLMKPPVSRFGPASAGPPVSDTGRPAEARPGGPVETSPRRSADGDEESGGDEEVVVSAARAGKDESGDS